MRTITLDYFTLLSPEPIKIQGVGNIISPTLRDIAKLNYNVYNIYVDALLTDIKRYYEIIDKHGDVYFSELTPEQKSAILDVKHEYEALPDEDKNNVSFFSLLLFDEIYRQRILDALNFFIAEKVIFSPENKLFLIFDKEGDSPSPSISPIGYLNHQNYEIIVNIILQRIGMAKPDTYGDNEKVKNKTASKILSKLKKAEAKKKAGNNASDKKMELANIISSLATHSKDLNMINIWDLTVYQLYDQFARQQLDDSYEICASSVSAWGDKDNKFDHFLWLSLIK